MNKQAYEAPKAVVVDFDNDYVVAGRSHTGGNAP